MSTTVSYKGSTIATLSNETKTLTTAGTWVEGDISITDNGGTAAISVVDTTDSHGGTIREITAIDISDTTATAGDVASGKYFYTASGIKTAGTGSGGESSETWEILWDDDVNFEYDASENYPYCEISALRSVTIEPNSVWRITYDNTEYRCTAETSGDFVTIGNILNGAVELMMVQMSHLYFTKLKMEHGQVK